MKNFEYGDTEIALREMAITISSMIIGVGVLTMPRLIAKTTQSSDGWISILIAGIVAIGFAWILAKLACLFHQQGFFAFTSSLVTKPAAIVITCAISLYFILFGAFEVRSIANIAKQFLFERTPVEYTALAFLVVVSYAVCGTRVGLIRLNTLFLPLVIIIAGVVLVFSAGIFHIKDLKPFFITDWKGIASGAKESVFALLGFELVLFYITLMNNPKDAPKAAVIGVSMPVLLYLIIYIVCVGTFSQQALKEVTYPVVELAKEVEIPGEFFERFESIFYTIWIMTIFNTATMAIDIAIYNLSYIFTKVTRKTWVFILSPVVYFISMLPQNVIEFGKLGTFISYLGIVSALLVPCALFVIAKIRGVKGS